jgi:hypothetical protein
MDAVVKLRLGCGVLALIVVVGGAEVGRSARRRRRLSL